jgi:hypothetical protein
MNEAKKSTTNKTIKDVQNVNNDIYRLGADPGAKYLPIPLKRGLITMLW